MNGPTAAHTDAKRRLPPTPEPMDKSMIREALENSGVFKNADALVRFCEADEYWERLPYGKRLYFGEGPADYLHRDVLRAALNALAELDKPGEGEVSGTGMVLTDEEIERIAKDLEDILCENEGVVRSSSWLYRDGAKDALRYARDNSYLSATAKAPAEVAPSPQAVTVEGKWISVDERLPELKYLVDQEGGRRSDAVLVYPNGSLGSVAYCYQKPGFDPRWYAIISVPAGYVTHWMPLPSAPASTNT